MSLDEILPEGITEVIVTTVSRDGIPNAAPMGIIRHGDSLCIRMYPDTRTYRNVRDTGHLIACITTDPLVYVISAFQDVSCSFFTPLPPLPPLIKDTCAWVYFRAEIEGVVKLTPVRHEILRRKVPSYSRGFASVIDATITGTRLRFMGEEGKKRIREDASIVARCGTPRDIEAMDKLKEILGL